MKIRVKAKPNSRINLVKQIDKDYYEVKVTVPPEKGKANERIIELLANHFNIPKSTIIVVKGESSREKVIDIPLGILTK